MGYQLKNKTDMSRSSVLNNKGTFLIEALLAIAIMAVSLTFIIHSVVSALRASTYVSDYTQAQFIGDNIMFDFIKDGLPSSQSKGTNGKFSYRFQTKTIEETAGLNQLHLQILWTQGMQNKKIELMTYVPVQ
jgi:Tfp pilus assembly protein PilV